MEERTPEKQSRWVLPSLIGATAVAGAEVVLAVLDMATTRVTQLNLSGLVDGIAVATFTGLLARREMRRRAAEHIS